MKKEYIQPALIVRDVKVNTILAGSEFGVNTSTNTYTSGSFGAKECSDFEEEPAVEKSWGSVW